MVHGQGHTITHSSSSRSDLPVEVQGHDWMVLGQGQGQTGWYKVKVILTGTRSSSRSDWQVQVQGHDWMVQGQGQLTGTRSSSRSDLPVQGQGQTCRYKVKVRLPGTRSNLKHLQTSHEKKC